MPDLRRERAPGAVVREEPLKATAGLRGILRLSSWRGRSGRRYVVGIHALAPSELVAVTGAVLIAVRRDREGVASLVAVSVAGEHKHERARRAWMANARSRGATEMHVHRLAEDEPERRAMIADLANEDDRGGESDARPAGGSAQRGREPGEHGVVDPHVEEVLVGGADVVGVRP